MKPQKAFRLFAGLIILPGLFLLGACGYQLTGKTTHLPPGVASLAIPTFVNRTLEPGIEIMFTRAFLDEFIRDRRVQVVDRAAADAVLEGTIKDFRISSVSYDRSGLATEYQTRVVADLALKKRTGEVLWMEKDLSEVRWYRSSSSDALTNEANKARAIQEMAQFVADRIRNRFFYEF